MVLKDRIALVTGAGSGIGSAVARAMAAQGAFVVLLARQQAPLETVHDDIRAAGGQATIVPLDLEKDLARATDLAPALAQRFGRLDILVNNAAVLGQLTPLSHYTPQMWEQVMRVNVTAPFFLTRQLWPLLEASGRASVINVVSGVGRKGRAYWGAYAASKAALINLTETWAGEMASERIRLNTLNPGPTRTSMRATAFPGEDPASLPAPQDIVPAFLYLASDHSLGVNGQHLQAREWRDWQPPQGSPGLV
ncbi:MAG: SDR family NAD(P)-dependent oxidoreductase [Magnetococcus sp. WYHC-3]